MEFVKNLQTNNFVVVQWFYQVFVTVLATIAGGIAIFMLRKRMIDSFLPEDEHDKNSTTFSIVATVLLAVLYITIMDILGISWQTNHLLEPVREYSTLTSLFYLPIIMCILFDVLGTVTTICAVAVACMCCPTQFSQSNSNLSFKNSHSIFIATSLVVVVLVVTNHSYYIMLSFIGDPVHANSTGIYYVISVLMYLFLFKLSWKLYFPTLSTQLLIISRICNPTYEVISESDTNITYSISQKSLTFIDRTNVEAVENDQKEMSKPAYLVINLLFRFFTVVLLVVPFQVLVTAGYVYSPIKRAAETVPTQLSAIYQSLIVAIGLLVTYKIFLKKADASLSDVLQELQAQTQQELEWVTVDDSKKEINLKKSDRTNILKYSFHLDDYIIYAAMILLKQNATREVNGLVDLAVINSNDSDPSKEWKGSLKKHGIQILYYIKDCSKQWITVSTIRPHATEQQSERLTVTVYGSQPEIKNDLPKGVKEVIKQLLGASEDSFDLEYADVQV